MKGDEEALSIASSSKWLNPVEMSHVVDVSVFLSFFFLPFFSKRMSLLTKILKKNFILLFCGFFKILFQFI